MVCFVEKLLSRTRNGKDMKILKVTAVRSGAYGMVRHSVRAHITQKLVSRTSNMAYCKSLKYIAGTKI